jgi:hypothetical protein
MKIAGHGLAYILLAAIVATGPVVAAPDAPVARTCTDMDGHNFSWQWSNVPFGSVCGDGPIQKTDAKPAKACGNDCAETAISCISQTFAAGDQGQTCSTNNAACLKTCENVKGP